METRRTRGNKEVVTKRRKERSKPQIKRDTENMQAPPEAIKFNADLKKTMEVLTACMENHLSKVMEELKKQHQETSKYVIELMQKNSNSDNSKETTLKKMLALQENTIKEYSLCMKSTIETVFKACDIDKEIENVTSEKEWKKKLSLRKNHYWKYYRNKSISAIYKKELQKETPRMPRKFQPTRINNEDPKELKIRRRGAVERFKCETQLLIARSDRHGITYEKIDEEMVSSFRINYPDEIAQILTKRWNEECEREEMTSKELYAKNIYWLLKNLTTELRCNHERKPTAKANTNLTEEFNVPQIFTDRKVQRNTSSDNVKSKAANRKRRKKHDGHRVQSST